MVPGENSQKKDPSHAIFLIACIRFFYLLVRQDGIWDILGEVDAER
jgi:hypothetical protein